MAGILTPETRAALEKVLADDDTTEPLEQVRDIRHALKALEDEPAVLAAIRRADTDWATIAAAAGLSPAAARWRWQGSDVEIAVRLEAGRKRSARPSSKPTDLPGHSVAEAASALGITVQAIYLRVSRGRLRSDTIELADGRKYKRVYLD